MSDAVDPAEAASPRVLGVILAAGAGSRFQSETHKLFALLDGRPVLAWAYEHAAAAALDGLIVVAGAIDVRPVLPADALVLDNPAWDSGQASSLQCALAYARSARCDAIVVGLGDQPFVPAETWQNVARHRGALVTATMQGQRTPPARIARELWPLLPTTGDEGARVLMRSRSDLVIEIACPGHPFDIDTVEDLQSWS